MNDQEESSTLTDLTVKVAILKQEVAFINKLFTRMDDLINKIDTQYDSLVDKTTKVESNLSFNKEEISDLYRSLEQSGKELSHKINSVEKLLLDEIKAINITLNSRLDKQETTTHGILETKWMLGGVVAFATWIFSNFDSVKKIVD